MQEIALETVFVLPDPYQGADGYTHTHTHTLNPYPCTLTLTCTLQQPARLGVKPCPFSSSEAGLSWSHTRSYSSTSPYDQLYCLRESG